MFLLGALEEPCLLCILVSCFSFCFLFEIRSHWPGICDPPVSASLVPEITGLCHRTRLGERLLSMQSCIVSYPFVCGI